MKNNGVITNLPADAIIESPGFVDRFGINMVAGITLPEACAATCVSSINVQRMSVHAAVSGDIDLLKLAVLHDPLVGAICTPEEVWQMVDEMVVAQADWLPQYADALPAAKERLARGTVKTRDWEGVARREVRSIEQLRADKAAKQVRGSRVSKFAGRINCVAEDEAHGARMRRKPDDPSGKKTGVNSR